MKNVGKFRAIVLYIGRKLFLHLPEPFTSLSPVQEFEFRKIDTDLHKIFCEANKDEIGPLGVGAQNQKKRLIAAADFCASRWNGDFIEIGCYLGNITSALAKVAKTHGRKVIALDPWEPGTQNISGNEYEIFLKNIEPFKDVVEIIRMSSLDKEAISQIKNRELCFAFVDGLHTYRACLSDIKTVSHCH